MKVLFDIVITLLATIILALPMCLIAIAIKAASRGSVLYWSTRIGKFNVAFQMPKFRTMRTSAPDLPTHRLKDPEKYITSIGVFLRKTSLDELPQLFSILKGDMSLVGPRPALHNQQDLIKLRTQKNVHTIKPGLTGLAQINGRDNLTTEKKVNLDRQYLKSKSFSLDVFILWKTIFKVLKKDEINH